MYALPWSHTIVSGTITGRAAACASRSSIAISMPVRQHRAGMRSASAQPGRIGSGVNARASSSAASTALVVGPQHRRGDRAGRQVDHPGQLDPVDRPSSSTTRTSSGVESICIHSPGRAAVTVPNGPSGRLGQRPAGAGRAEVCRPRRAARTAGRSVRSGGIAGRASVLGLAEQLLHPAAQPGDGARGPVGLPSDRLADGLDHPGVDVPGRGGARARAPVDQPHRALRAHSGAAAAGGPQPDPVPGRGQFRGLGQLPLPQRALGRIVRRTGSSARVRCPAAPR